MRTFGLIGFPLEHSFSKSYFSDKFSREKINDTVYENFELGKIDLFHDLIHNHTDLRGLNVTIPYKKSVIEFLDELDEEAKTIDAVNAIKIRSNKLTGYNTDHIGFTRSLVPLLKQHHQKALILGTGGASKAVKYSLEKLGIAFQVVSRNPTGQAIGYDRLKDDLFSDFKLIINTTPVGMSPKIDEAPDVPYDLLTPDHLCYDLIYNPEETLFLKKAKEQSATVKNGYEMLVLQAEAAWRIWNSF